MSAQMYSSWSCVHRQRCEGSHCTTTPPGNKQQGATAAALARALGREKGAPTAAPPGHVKRNDEGVMVEKKYRRRKKGERGGSPNPNSGVGSVGDGKSESPDLSA